MVRLYNTTKSPPGGGDLSLKKSEIINFNPPVGGFRTIYNFYLTSTLTQGPMVAQRANFLILLDLTTLISSSMLAANSSTG